MPFVAKVILFLFALAVVLLALALCKLNGYWDRIEEQEDLDMKFKGEDNED